MSKVIASIFPERRFVSFSHRNNRFVFFSIVSELIAREHVVLDFGAGRGRQAATGGPHLRALATFKGRCRKLIGVDVDPIVLENPLVDEAHVIVPGERLPFEDDSIDVIYSHATFEHVVDPEPVAAELTRVLRPGGWICASTPHKWGYVGLGARLFPNKYHVRMLKFIEPGGRDEQDIFPTVYKMNTQRALRRLFPTLENHSFIFNGEPSYHFGSGIVARVWLSYMALMPRSLGKTLMIFLHKPPLRPN